MTMSIYRTYSELISLVSFDERFRYLKLEGQVGIDTFGFDRYLNQALYKSREWKDVRNYVILRDNACDLGCEDYEIFDKRRIIIHHMNPITIDQVKNRDKDILNPEFLITTSLRTHNAIHYCNDDYETLKLAIRSKNDTCPWK